MERSQAERSEPQLKRPRRGERALEVDRAREHRGQSESREHPDRLVAQTTKSDLDHPRRGRIEPLHVVERHQHRAPLGHHTQDVQETEPDRARIERVCLAQQGAARPRVLAAATAQALKQPHRKHRGQQIRQPTKRQRGLRLNTSMRRKHNVGTATWPVSGTPTSHKIVFPTPGSPERMSIDGPSANPSEERLDRSQARPRAR